MDQVLPVAVFSTMWVRDHARPLFHDALGIDIDEYDHKVLNLTSEISQQVFPIALDMKNPRWDRGLRSMNKAFQDMDKAKKRGGVMGAIGKMRGRNPRSPDLYQPLYDPVEKG